MCMGVNCHSMSVTLEDNLHKLAPSLNCGCSRNQLTLSGLAATALTSETSCWSKGWE